MTTNELRNRIDKLDEELSMIYSQFGKVVVLAGFFMVILIATNVLTVNWIIYSNLACIIIFTTLRLMVKYTTERHPISEVNLEEITDAGRKMFAHRYIYFSAASLCIIYTYFLMIAEAVIFVMYVIKSRM